MRISDSDTEIVGRALTPEFLGELRRQRTAVGGDHNNLHHTEMCHCERPHAVTQNYKCESLKQKIFACGCSLKAGGGAAVADE